MTLSVELQLDSPEARERTLVEIDRALLISHQILFLDCRKCLGNTDTFIKFMEEVGELLEKHSQWEVGHVNVKGYIGLIRRVRNVIKVNQPVMATRSGSKQYIQ